MIRYRSYIYEGASPTPTLLHEFYGETPQEVQGVFRAHMKTDAFLNAAYTTKRWNGFAIRIIDEWEQFDLQYGTGLGGGAWVRIAPPIPL